MRNRIAVVVAVVALVALAAVSTLYALSRRPAGPKFETGYQAVLLAGGQAYFGKLEGLGTPYPVLTEVYYVQQTTNPETKQVSNILVKRGREWHAPDRMYLNASQIVLVEPVNPNSKVAQLIAESRNR